MKLQRCSWRVWFSLSAVLVATSAVMYTARVNLGLTAHTKARPPGGRLAAAARSEALGEGFRHSPSQLPSRLRNLNSQAPNPRVIASYGKLPLSFEANQGQTDSQVRFVSRGRGYSLFLTGDEAVLTLRGGSQKSKVKSQKAKIEDRFSALSGQLSASGNRKFETGNSKFGDRTSAFPDLESRIFNLPSLIPNPQSLAPSPEAPAPSTQSPAPSVVRMKLVGANPKAKVTGLDPLPGKSNYFIGNDPKKWRTNVSNYAKVKYEGVYPGIDLVYYGNQRQLEYDWVVAPGADPNAIRFAVETGNSKLETGNSKLENRKPKIDSDGDLVIETDAGEVRFHKPVVYQPSVISSQSSVAPNPESRVPNPGSSNSPFTIRNSQLVDGRFVLTASNQVRFHLGPYDKTKPLVIDPYIVYGAYLGGTGQEFGIGIAADATGSAYVFGAVWSDDFPVSPGALQTTCIPYYYNGLVCNGNAFITKFAPDGKSLVYSTYLGGSGGDTGNFYGGIAVDASGNAFVTGRTVSTDFPTTSGALKSTCVLNPAANNEICFGNAFVSKISPDGTQLLYSTYLGGSYGAESSGIAVGPSGNLYVTGWTGALDFPTTAGGYQTTCPYPNPQGGCISSAFLTELNPSASGAASLVYSSYFGVSESTAYGVAVDTTGHAYIAGNGLVPHIGNYFDADGIGFLAKFDTSQAGPASVIYSTQTCGAGSYSVAVDTSGNAYLTGQTPTFYYYGCPAIPAPNGFQTVVQSSSAFLLKVNSTGSGVLYSTYLGGNGDVGWDVAVDSSGNAYVTGQTSSADFPILDAIIGVYPSGNSWGTTGFVTKIDTTQTGQASLVYSTFLGGAGGEVIQAGAVDPSGNAYVTGFTNPNAFLVTPGNFNRFYGNDGTYNGGVMDVIVMKISPDNAPQVGVSVISVTFPDEPPGTSSPPASVTIGSLASVAFDVTSIQTLNDDGTPSLDFTVDPGTCLRTYLPGDRCTLTVTFAPQSGTTAAPSAMKSDFNAPSSLIIGRTPPKVTSPRGTRIGKLQASSTIPSSTSTGDANIDLKGDVLLPEVTLTPTSLTFSSQTVGTTSAPQTVTLKNTGNTDLIITSLVKSGGNSANFGISYNCPRSPSPLAAAGSCWINVTFTPNAAGPRKSLVVITDNAAGSPHKVILTGIGSALTFAPSSWNFGSQQVGTTSPAKAITLSNLGASPLHIWSSILSGNNPGAFGRVNSCPAPPATLAGSASCTINVTFTPTAVGARTAVLQISHDGGASPYSVALAGVGTTATASPASGLQPATDETPREPDAAPLRPRKKTPLARRPAK